MAAVLFWLLTLVGGVHGEERWNVSSFNNAPALLENVGRALFYKDEWTVLIKMRPVQFENVLGATLTCAKQLKSYCGSLEDEPSVERSIVANCKQLARDAVTYMDTLQKENSFLARSRGVRRKTRSINPVGHFFNWAFGTMDNRDAENIYGQLGVLANTTQQCLTFADKQITLVKAAYEDMHKPMEQLMEDVDKITHQLNLQQDYIRGNIHTLTSTVQWLQFELKAQTLINRLLAAMTSLGHYMEIERTVWSQLFNKQLPPSLMEEGTIQELYSNISQIAPLHAGLRDFGVLHKLITLAVWSVDEVVYIKMKIPLPGQEEFVVKRAYGLPQVSSTGQRTALSIPSDYIAQGQYHVKALTWMQLQACKVVATPEGVIRVCENEGVMESTQSESCVTELLKLVDAETTLCRHVVLQEQWNVLMAMEAVNTWLFSFENPRTFRVSCGKERGQLTINGTGVLRVKANCEFWDGKMVLPYSFRGEGSALARESYELPIAPVFNVRQPQLLNLEPIKMSRLEITDHSGFKSAVLLRTKQMEAAHQEVVQAQAVFNATSNTYRLEALQQWTTGTSVSMSGLALIGVVVLCILYARRLRQNGSGTTTTTVMQPLVSAPLPPIINLRPASPRPMVMEMVPLSGSRNEGYEVPAVRKSIRIRSDRFK